MLSESSGLFLPPWSWNNPHGGFMNLAMAAEQAASRGGSGYWQLALILAAIGFLGLFARWRKMRAPAIPTAKELRERDDSPNRYRDAADRAIVELLETSRSLNAQVDTKIRMLNRLVKEAEENCTRLENLLARAQKIPLDGETRLFAAETKVHVPEPVQQEKPRKPETQKPKFLSDLHERIFRLQQAGKTVQEIARATNLSTTEVEFFLKTFKNR